MKHVFLAQDEQQLIPAGIRGREEQRETASGSQSSHCLGLPAQATLALLSGMPYQPHPPAKLSSERPSCSLQGYHDIVSVIFLTLPKELHLPVVEKLSLHRVRDSMGTNLDPVVGLLRYGFSTRPTQAKLIRATPDSILQRLLRLADPKFAAILDRYVLPPRATTPGLTAEQHRTTTILCPI